jgi:hypothetical protein
MSARERCEHETRLRDRLQPVLVSLNSRAWLAEQVGSLKIAKAYWDSVKEIEAVLDPDEEWVTCPGCDNGPYATYCQHCGGVGTVPPSLAVADETPGDPRAPDA